MLYVKTRLYKTEQKQVDGGTLTFTKDNTAQLRLRASTDLLSQYVYSYPLFNLRNLSDPLTNAKNCRTPQWSRQNRKYEDGKRRHLPSF